METNRFQTALGAPLPQPTSVCLSCQDTRHFRRGLLQPANGVIKLFANLGFPCGLPPRSKQSTAAQKNAAKYHIHNISNL